MIKLESLTDSYYFKVGGGSFRCFFSLFRSSYGLGQRKNIMKEAEFKGRLKQRDIMNIFNTMGCCLHDSKGLYEKMFEGISGLGSKKKKH